MRRYPCVWPAPMIISTSGRLSDSSPVTAPGARAERLERLNVLADAVGELAAGQRGVAEEQHRLVLVALERADREVAGVQGMAQQVVTHAFRLERVTEMVSRAGYPGFLE